jgi:hypothetical protein
MFQQTLQHRLHSRNAVSLFPTILSAILYLHSAQMNVRVFLSPSFSAPSLKYTNALYRRRKVFLFFVKQMLLSVFLPDIAFSVRLISLSVVPFSHLSFYLSLSALRMYVQKLTAACSPSSKLYNL